MVDIKLISCFPIYSHFISNRCELFSSFFLFHYHKEFAFISKISPLVNLEGNYIYLLFKPSSTAFILPASPLHFSTLREHSATRIPLFTFTVKIQ